MYCTSYFLLWGQSGIVLIWGVVQNKFLEYREYFAR